MIKTNDDGYLLAGYSNHHNNGGDYDVWLIKTDIKGDVLWEKVLGYEGQDDLFPKLTKNGNGYLVTASSGGNVSLINIDADGNAPAELVRK